MHGVIVVVRLVLDHRRVDLVRTSVGKQRRVGARGEAHVGEATRRSLQLWPRFLLYTLAFLVSQLPDPVLDLLSLAHVQVPQAAWIASQTLCQMHGFFTILRVLPGSASGLDFVAENLTSHLQPVTA